MFGDAGRRLGELGDAITPEITRNRRGDIPAFNRQVCEPQNGRDGVRALLLFGVDEASGQGANVRILVGRNRQDNCRARPGGFARDRVGGHAEWI